MPHLVYLLLGLTLMLALLGVAEYAAHRSRLAKIPVRVHVNGTRGKSSVTRLVAAGLREAGVRCLAKTTGTIPRYILPNGREFPVDRLATANIIEQKRAVAVAAAHNVDVLVVECMALQPHLQWLSEARLVRATHGVITNARPDHLDVMGPTEKDVALALAGTTPRGGTLLTTAGTHVATLERASTDRESELIAVDPAEADLTDAEIKNFSYREHRENVALALATCRVLGVERDVALQGMWRAQPDAGAMIEHRCHFYGRDIVFVNGFAANDPVSTEQIWRNSLNVHRDVSLRIAVFNCRADRAQRSKQLAEAYVQWPQADEVVLIGDGQYIFARTAVGKGLDPTRLSFVDMEHPGDIFEVLIGLVSSSALVMGMGNIGGPGLGLTEYFRNRGERIA